jgi:single-strand DNA-binding protein
MLRAVALRQFVSRFHGLAASFIEQLQGPGRKFLARMLAVSHPFLVFQMGQLFGHGHIDELVQQNHPHRPPRTERRSQDPQNNREYVVLNIATQESWKNDKGDYETRSEWHRVYAWRDLSKFAKTLQKGQLITLEGTLRYREVEDKIDGTTFKHRIAEIHAISMKRLSKIEAADDPAGGAGDE